ncbi:hypothetical protein ACFLWA_10740 [Chloroflexota bacterium]
MTVKSYSKPLEQADESAKELIIEVLTGEHTYGFDIDSIYYYESEDKWVVLEFLKCDHKTVRPSKSHPKRYWGMNWRKFASLWRLAQSLGGVLLLVNYEDQEHAETQGRTEREFCVIRVDDMDPSESGGITKEKVAVGDFAWFKKWFQDLNARGAK